MFKHEPGSLPALQEPPGMQEVWNQTKFRFPSGLSGLERIGVIWFRMTHAYTEHNLHTAGLALFIYLFIFKNVLKEMLCDLV